MKKTLFDQLTLRYKEKVPGHSLYNQIYPEAVSSFEIDNSDKLVAIESAPKLLIQSFYFKNGLPESSDTIFLRAKAYERLLVASELLPDGVKLLVLDGWRSQSLQTSIHKYFRELLDNSGIDPGKYAFDENDKGRSDFPTIDAPHRTGGAIDLTLIDDDGEIWDMGGDFDEPSLRSRTTYCETHDSPNKMGRLGRRILFYTMKNAGFTNYPEEWWHYDFGNAFWRYYACLPEEKNIYRTVI